MLTIHGYAQSINVRKVFWTCDEIGIPFESVEWGGSSRPTSEPTFLALNPVGLVPVIVDGRHVVWESNVIVRYLASSRGRADLLPESPLERAHTEQWMDWQASDFNNGWRVLFQALVRNNPEFQDTTLIAREKTRLAKLMRILDARLELTNAYVSGTEFTVADIVIGLSLHRCISIPFDVPQFSSIDCYLERLAARPGFQRYGPGFGP